MLENDDTYVGLQASLSIDELIQFGVMFDVLQFSY
jgi:hypothetical protein